jgi:hypothetical protein
LQVVQHQLADIVDDRLFGRKQQRRSMWIHQGVVPGGIVRQPEDSFPGDVESEALQQVTIPGLFATHEAQVHTAIRHPLQDQGERCRVVSRDTHSR